MARRIVSQDDARGAYLASGLCYLCGQPLPILDIEDFSRNDPAVDRDHVVPEKIFSPADRTNFPLLLRVHKSCNVAQSEHDQKFAELFRLLWDPSESDDFERLKLEWEVDSEGRATASYWKDDDLRAIVFRWIKGLHYALYGEVLADDTRRATSLPFLQVNAGRSATPTLEHHVIAALIRRQRILKSLDEVICYNGRLIYQCAWMMEGNLAKCVYALDVNGWSIFSGEKAGPYRSGQGFFLTPAIPVSATRASNLALPSMPSDLDLFPEQRQRYLGMEKIRKRLSYRRGNFPIIGDPRVPRTRPGADGPEASG